jgi:DNA-binding GntR family transcriptional regulator
MTSILKYGYSIPMTRSERGTRAEAVYTDLRSDILSGRLRPGERLKFPDLALRYAVGVGAIREALARLVEQDLVRSQPHMGFHVVPLSVEDLSALTEARIDLEGLLFRRSMQLGDMTWETGVVSSHYALERTPQHDRADPDLVTEAWTEAHGAFHRALLAGSASARILDIALQMRDAAAVYQSWSQQQRLGSRRAVVAEHRNLMNLALSRDVEAGVAAIAEHLTRTTEVLLARLDVIPTQDAVP